MECYLSNCCTHSSAVWFWRHCRSSHRYRKSIILCLPRTLCADTCTWRIIREESERFGQRNLTKIVKNHLLVGGFLLVAGMRDRHRFFHPGFFFIKMIRIFWIAQPRLAKHCLQFGSIRVIGLKNILVHIIRYLFFCTVFY